jgi:hypothetical protein
MVKYILFLFTLLFVGVINAQNLSQSVEIGDQFIISQPISDTYKHIDFPKKNIIIKRGAIADFKSLNGLKLMVTDITYSKSQDQIVTLKRVDGKPFFRFFNTVEANLDKAIASNELKVSSK